MPPKGNAKTGFQDRITITLGPGQRKLLEDIAKYNNATISYVIRCALREFLESHKDKQLRLSF